MLEKENVGTISGQQGWLRRLASLANAADETESSLLAERVARLETDVAALTPASTKAPRIASIVALPGATWRETLPFAGERFVFHTSVGFDKVLANLKSRVGRTSVENIVSLGGTIEDYEREVNRIVGVSGFILFAELDHSQWIERYGINQRVVRWVFGNPLIAITMLKHDLSAGLFVPVELLITEAEDAPGCSVTYVLPSSLICIGEDPDLLAAARSLDEKFEALISTSLNEDAPP